MDIIINAYRINKNETTVFITFSQITNSELKCVDSTTITNSKGDIGVIFHVQNITKDVINSGRDIISFKADFKIDTEKIRVFYWNDSGSLSDNLYCFEEFLETHGLDERILEEIIPCENSQNKAKDIPRQAGNGGVLRIVNIP